MREGPRNEIYSYLKKSGLKTAMGFGRAALDLALPPACMSCNDPVDRPGALCGACWGQIEFIAPPFCKCCGMPFEFEQPGEAICAGCLAHPPRYAHARSVMIYNDASRVLAIGFKHKDRLEGAPSFAAWMARAGQDLLVPGAVLVPVPLHRWRLFARRYNQAGLLALGIALETGLGCEPLMLARIKRTPSQRGLTAKARRRNVAGAFQVRPQFRERVKGMYIVLVDDVFTTGATAEACARVLCLAGAAQVDVLTLARVAGPGRST
jgi:ComF family protein